MVCDPIVGASTYIFGAMVMQIMLALKNLDEKEGIFGGKFYQINCAIHFCGWLTQFVGHGIFEKRAPALTKNLLFMFIAPFFDMFEVLNKLFGYKQAEVKKYFKIIDADIAHYRISKGYSVDLKEKEEEKDKDDTFYGW